MAASLVDSVTVEFDQESISSDRANLQIPKKAEDSDPTEPLTWIKNYHAENLV